MLFLLIQHQEIIFAIKLTYYTRMMLTSLSFERNVYLTFLHSGNWTDQFMWEFFQSNY